MAWFGQRVRTSATSAALEGHRDVSRAQWNLDHAKDELCWFLDALLNKDHHDELDRPAGGFSDGMWNLANHVTKSMY